MISSVCDYQNSTHLLLLIRLTFSSGQEQGWAFGLDNRYEFTHFRLRRLKTCCSEIDGAISFVSYFLVSTVRLSTHSRIRHRHVTKFIWSNWRLFRHWVLWAKFDTLPTLDPDGAFVSINAKIRWSLRRRIAQFARQFLARAMEEVCE